MDYRKKTKRSLLISPSNNNTTVHIYVNSGIIDINFDT
jgi:hypothetical protein